MKTLLLLVIGGFLVQPAFANDSEKTEHACKADVEKFCKDIKVGEGRILRCLKEHQDSLSPECKAKGQAIKEKMKEKRAELKEACSDDFQKFCKGVRGPKKRLDCLKNHSSELNESCKSALPN